MASRTVSETMRIGGMTCVNCQNRIEKKLNNTRGITSASVSYNNGTAKVTYDPSVISSREIAAVIQKTGYEVLAGGARKSTESGSGIILIIIALYLLSERLGLTRFFGNFSLAESGMDYGMLFIIGLITSVHCVAMCGGINLSQCIPQSGGKSALMPSFLYNLGRVISYTVIGGIVGAIGGVITPSGAFRGAVQIIAGVFMVIMGLNMLDLFPELRRFVPRMPRFFAGKIDAEKSSGKGPLYVGLLNGLMPCGPLQAMQLYALSVGSPLKAALSMMLFSLGTVPLMFGLGALSTVLSKKFTQKMMTAGAVLVAVLGLSMFSQGLSLSGGLPVLPSSPSAGESANANAATVVDGVTVVNSTLSPFGYPAITVEAGKPVRWIINAPQGSINGCNNRMFIQEYGIEYQFQPGENIIEFTPQNTGTFRYSCWMGMIRSTITVI